MRYFWDYCVSTHSRPKAAGRSPIGLLPIRVCFNTQPPEGGWKTVNRHSIQIRGFNTQPPEGGWPSMAIAMGIRYSFNTQPPEGGWTYPKMQAHRANSFNTQPPEGGWD